MDEANLNQGRHGFSLLLRTGAVVTLLVLFVGCATGKPATLVGTLWWTSPTELAQPAPFWDEELEYIQQLGMDTLIMNGPYFGAETHDGEQDATERFLDATDARGMHVFIDTCAATEWWTLVDPAAEIARAVERIRYIESRYGAHPSFTGFYVPYELYVMWGPQRDLITALYGEVSRACKAAAPDKPVMISPFFVLDDEGRLGDFRYATPDEYQAFWTSLLAQTAIDIVALQDSGEHLSYYTIEERRPFFAAMKAACDATGKTFWANIETGEMNVASRDEYVARFGWKTHVNDLRLAPYWHGVPADKLAAKLAFAGEFTGTAITWGYREFIRPANGTLASELYLDYFRALK
ncbi:MAG: DUF4434 domain-containing protein [Candidatus Hydrogenedentes bacterium]|nr:DUF4434 domain-containing protein [Candidatus Hydrogenedentota bacterium]